ncbi:uncharacterized protein CcaverHIS019_0202930 [Cutaneotrichosporon cavernicola]|uniref:Zn(2)-C6 fungal-type domain-containing protein n=1 Tax=Cutaneotrichosporon cavernicola TaxID=279322 RepID=A0AA48I0L9_9TREE|nr:uncharacterized protein CcaverHIS019_0202930 [Cutaneotrichosporon cavernicola]BEI88931.1 hypothetical protein CcaverHIS019_0202930 [Cutaneotrichosporon cavernicola]
MPPSPKHGQVGNAPEKKKRRQNVACDSCRLRRVKCDMLALLTPADSTRVMPPLPVLVRQNPDVSCSNCISKGIRCTTNQIVNPSKPNKGGKRIEEAKKMYGSEGLFTTLTGPSAPTTPSLTYTGPQPPPIRHDSVATARTSASSASSSSYDLTDVPTTVDLANTGFLFTTIQYPYSGTDLLNQGTSPTGSTCELGPAWSTEWSSNAVSTPYGTPFAGGMFDMTAQAPGEPQMFDTFMLSPGANAPYPPAQALLYAAPPSLYVSSADSVPAVPTLPDPPPLSLGSTLDGASGAKDPSAFPSLVSDGNLDTRSDHPFRILSSGDNSPVPPPAQLPSSSVGLPAVTSVYPTPSLPTKRSASIGPSQIVGKKRHHADDDVLDLVRTYGQIVRDYGDNAETGPWALWAKSKDKEDKIIRWSRSNSVGDELASRALGSELSRELVKVYFSSVHLTLPAISPETFYRLWKQAGERSDRMSPAQEVLCAVIEAWAARFSDHPVVLGMNPNEQHTGPKLILATESDHSGSLIVDQSHYGQKRLRVCFALVERARKLIDQHGILRKPSLTGVQALALFTQLQHMTDHNPEAPEHLMEIGEMLHTILVQQLRRLDGCWVPEGSIPIVKDDGPETQQEQRIKLRRLWWTVFIADSFWAAGTCSTPVVPEEEVKASLAWLDAIDPRHMPSTFDSISFFMGHFHRVSTITRMVAYKLCLPSKRPGRVDVDEFCSDARVIWRNVRDLYQDINSKVEDVLSIAKEDILGFSPVHQFCSLRLAATYILLIMQQVIQQLLDFRKRLHEAYVYDSTVPLQAQPEGTRVSALNELHAQSIDILLANARAQAPMFDTLLPTGFMQGASMLARVLLAVAQFLSEVPTNEQGYPNHTRGGVDWTWENKQAEVEKCVKALHQLGWAWADVSPVLLKIKMNMVRMTPTQETLLSYAFKAQNMSEDAARQAARRDSDGRRDSQALDAVLEFWPPTSVPKVLGSMNAGQYATKQQDAYNYSRGNFEYQPSERNSSFPGQRTGDPTPSTGSNSRPAARPSTSTGTAVHPVDPIHDDFTFGSSEGIGSATAAGWTALGAPRSSATVPLTSELVDLTDFTDAKLQADLESFIETLVKDMSDA